MANKKNQAADINTRERIQQAANRLFNEKGYEKTSITMICEAAGVSKTTLHYYFPKKQDLMYDMKNYFEDIYNKNLYRVFAKETFVLQIWELYQIMCEGDIYYGPKIVAQHFSQLLRDHEERDYINKIYHRRILISLIQSAQREKQILNACPPEEICNSMTYAARGLIVTWSIEDGSFDLVKRMKDTVELILDPAPGFRINENSESSM